MEAIPSVKIQVVICRTTPTRTHVSSTKFKLDIIMTIIIPAPIRWAVFEYSGFSKVWKTWAAQAIFFVLSKGRGEQLKRRSVKRRVDETNAGAFYL